MSWNWLNWDTGKKQRTAAKSTSRRYLPRIEALEDRLTPVNLPAGFAQVPLAGIVNEPTAMEIAPDGRIFVLQQTGDVRVFKDGSLLPNAFLHVNVDSTGERGLLGIAFDPDFNSNHWVYLYYTVPGSNVHNRVSRFTANGDTVAPNSEFVLVDLDPLSAATNHNGGAIHFGREGFLYVSVGDNANGANAQTLSNRLGKILRYTSTGGIPTNNPFYSTASGANRAIWALGLRNPFTFAVQPGTGRIFLNDVGQGTFEEINDGIGGANYGWPSAEGPSSNPAFVNPIFSYTHGTGNDHGDAITGAAFYNPNIAQFPPDYVGDYFFADLTHNWIRRFDPNTGVATLFATDLPFGTVDLKVDANGSLYYLSRGSGELVRISLETTAADRRFVGALYTDFLGRTGSTAELDSWARQLPSLGRATVVRAIQHSFEAHVRLVDSFYSYFLGRAADGVGRASWVSQLDRGAKAEQLMIAFLSSPEFGARANTLEGTANANENYIRSLYRLLLRRPGNVINSADVDSWLTILPRIGRDGVAANFVNSQEFRAVAIRTFYGPPTSASLPIFPNVLNRATPTPNDQVASWASSPLHLREIEFQFAASPEYYANG